MEILQLGKEEQHLELELIMMILARHLDGYFYQMEMISLILSVLVVY